MGVEGAPCPVQNSICLLFEPTPAMQIFRILGGLCHSRWRARFSSGGRKIVKVDS